MSNEPMSEERWNQIDRLNEFNFPPIWAEMRNEIRRLRSAPAQPEQATDYYTDDCTNCGRMRIQRGGDVERVCEKCGFKNAPAQQSGTETAMETFTAWARTAQSRVLKPAQPAQETIEQLRSNLREVLEWYLDIADVLPKRIALVELHRRVLFAREWLEEMK